MKKHEYIKKQINNASFYTLSDFVALHLDSTHLFPIEENKVVVLLEKLKVLELKKIFMHSVQYCFEVEEDGP